MTDPKSTNSTARYDPYKNFKFRLKWDGKYVAGISKISGLKKTTEVVKHREGADPSAVESLLGRTKYEAITLERGVTNDAAFQQWATTAPDGNNITTNRPQSATSHVAASTDLRKDIILEVYNEAGQQVQAYNIFGCWISEYQAFPDTNSADAVAIQHIKLEYERSELDMPVQ